MKALSRFSHPHYVVNFILSVSFFILKILPPVCEILFDDCHLELVMFNNSIIAHYFVLFFLVKI